MPQYKTLIDTILAGQTRPYPCRAGAVRVTEATVPFELSTDGGPFGTIDRGMQVRCESRDFIELVQVRAPAGSALTFTLAFFDGTIDDNRQAGAVDATVVAGTVLGDSADLAIVAAAAAVVVLAALATRKEAIISNMGANACRIGTTTTGAARGIYLASGETIVLETTAAIYCYSAGGCTLSLAWTAE